jgi:acyl dehydratase
MIDRSHIGFTTAPTEVNTDPWRIKLFCQAIGETDPVYQDLDAAQAAGFEGRPLPPTFLKAIEGEHFSSASMLQLLNVPMRGVMHAEQSFEYLEPVYASDMVTVSRSIADIHDKKDGALTFILIDTRYEVDGRLVATSRQTVVVRNTLVAQ